MQKYFLAILPPEGFREKVEDLKQEIKEKFGIKYALKSPAHITVKMPFTYNEAKELKLFGQLEQFCSGQQPFELFIRGTDSFGRRVVFLDVEKQERLVVFQEQLKEYCKRDLKMVSELSDRNFHPHMTVAFKDMKTSYFEDVMKLVKEKKLNCRFEVSKLTLLKRVLGRWEVWKEFELKKIAN
ncbi:2'-5' RNA ligase family protein [Algoriphagus sp. CAU 1675]|uniref:2'-5' RNA ligase family protein n=1 Tax=Algoriphagus sp. CAU 1675 TaxID=3032597 RepID=UPI0023DB68D7|nr:2'-5' RNA ligase family protein [Algoriphagus sp. CAU 1675]MDF2156263.1 2'-5' RNA ligase family protein [Algoriphagus sp. CAU 1675]